jgi:hypothetical protein
VEQHRLWHVVGEFERRREQRRVSEHFCGAFEPTTRSDDHFWLRVLDALRELRGRKAAEDNGVHGANSCAR